MPTAKIPPVLRTSTGGEKEVAVDGSTVGDALRSLAAELAPDPGKSPDRLSARWLGHERIDIGRLVRLHPDIVAQPGNRRSRAGGTGLGLSIAAENARLLGGRITVRSEIGAGAAFDVWLPAS